MTTKPLLVITAEDDLLDRVLTICAAAGCEPTVTPDPGTARSLWPSASMIIVGVDVAAGAVAAGLPRRSGIFVVGVVDDGPTLTLVSAPLGAAVVVLPEGGGWLAGAISEATTGSTGRGRTVAVIGGSGGVGASTLAVAMAEVSARRGRSTMVIDGDPYGGGIDLVLRAEAFEGWRWPRLAAARGRLGDLTSQLVVVDRITVLSHARDDLAAVSAEAARSVLASARESHQLAVVDLARPPDPVGRALLAGCDELVVVVAAAVRPVAAARQLLDGLAETGGARTPTLVVRTVRAGAIDADSVGRSLGLPVAEVMADDPAVARAADTGRPAGRTGRHGLARVAAALIERIHLQRSAA